MVRQKRSEVEAEVGDRAERISTGTTVVLIPTARLKAKTGALSWSMEF